MWNSIPKPCDTKLSFQEELSLSLAPVWCMHRTIGSPTLILSIKQIALRVIENHSEKKRHNFHLLNRIVATHIHSHHTKSLWNHFASESGSNSIKTKLRRVFFWLRNECQNIFFAVILFSLVYIMTVEIMQLKGKQKLSQMTRKKSFREKT